MAIANKVCANERRGTDAIVDMKKMGKAQSVHQIRYILLQKGEKDLNYP